MYVFNSPACDTPTSQPKLSSFVYRFDFVWFVFVCSNFVSFFFFFGLFYGKGGEASGSF